MNFLFIANLLFGTKAACLSKHLSLWPHTGAGLLNPLSSTKSLAEDQATPTCTNSSHSTILTCLTHTLRTISYCNSDVVKFGYKQNLLEDRHRHISTHTTWKEGASREEEGFRGRVEKLIEGICLLKYIVRTYEMSCENHYYVLTSAQ